MAPNPPRNTLIGHLAQEDQEFQQQDIKDIKDNDDAEEGQTNKVDEVKRKRKIISRIRKFLHSFRRAL